MASTNLNQAMMNPDHEPTTKKPSVQQEASFRATRIRFVDEAQPSAGRPRFTQPRLASIAEEDASIETVAAARDLPESSEQLFLIHVPEGSSNQIRERARALVDAPERAEANRMLIVEHGSDSLEWRPGFAIVSCRDKNRNDIISALVDFAFYEGNLRALEQSVVKAELQAQSDVALAHRVRYRDRAQWGRLTDCAEQCSRMRLTFARLEPQLYAACEIGPSPARRWITPLTERSNIETRLESLNDRLEALEEFYEGANQRISEYRWYKGGHALEIIIIVILLIETVMIGFDLYLHNSDRHAAFTGTGSDVVVRAIVSGEGGSAAAMGYYRS
jgi:hypothetical protein